MSVHTNLPSLYPAQRERLRAFRRAAADLYRTLGEKIGAPLSVGSKGTQLLSEVDLRAAAPALRLTLLEREQAYFPEVVAVLRLLQDPAVTARVDHLSAAWARVETGQIGFHYDDGLLQGKLIRDAWLYGQLTHHGDQWQEALGHLREQGELAVFALQAAFLGHARLVMALDAAIADILDEPHVWTRRDARDERFFG